MHIDFDVANGIAITRIFEPTSGRDYLFGPSPFFKFAVNNGEAFTSDTGVSVYSVTPGFSAFTVGARSNDGQVDFSLAASLEADSAAAIFELTATNLTAANMFLRVVLPCVLGVRTPGDPANMMGMISKEAGSVVPLSETSVFGVPETPLGMRFIVDIGLPNSRNNMELASIFDSLTGGGVFFCDMDGELDNGIAPLQFTLDSTAVLGFCIADIPAHSSITLSRLAIGVHSDGDWHKAVDFYTSVHRPRWAFPATPAWLSDAGAVYTAAGGGAGGIYLSLPPAYLSKPEGENRGSSGRISSFCELPVLLDEANGLGTNILYLVDYWEGAGDLQPDGQPTTYYVNKGDYTPRLDLGGACDLIKGIDAVHARGGRVLLYLEPFTVYKNSIVGRSQGSSGPLCAGQDVNRKFWGLEISDRIYPNYPDAYEMVSCCPEWHEYMVETAVRLVRDYHADGVFLDSYAWQMNRWMQDKNGNIYPAQAYAMGVLTLAADMRAAIQQFNPDAVVIGECTAGPIARYWDGGLNADLGFGNIWLYPPDSENINQVQRLTASPVRYGIPEVRMFGNGWTLNGLHQFFAAGHGLALCSNFEGGGFMFDNAAHIKQLVEIRTNFRDALIHGQQINQPSTDNPFVIAYQYQGSVNRILTIVNLSDTNIEANISLDTPDPGGTWRDLLSKPSFFGGYSTKNGVIENVTLTTGPGSILVLQNIHHRPGERPEFPGS